MTTLIQDRVRHAVSNYVSHGIIYVNNKSCIEVCFYHFISFDYFVENFNYVLSLRQAFLSIGVCLKVFVEWLWNELTRSTSFISPCVYNNVVSIDAVF